MLTKLWRAECLTISKSGQIARLAEVGLLGRLLVASYKIITDCYIVILRTGGPQFITVVVDKP